MMITFNLNNQFKLVPAGQRVLNIEDIKYVPSGAPKDVKITWKDNDGGTIQDNISLDKGLWKLSVLCNKAFGVQDGETMDLKDICDKLKGLSFDCEVIHNQGTRARDDGTFPTFANIKSYLSLHELPESAMPTTMTGDKSPRESIAESADFLNDL